MAITKVVLPNGKVDKLGGWGKPQSKRALSDGVAAEVTNVLQQNALYGTGSGSGDGVHVNAGKTGTTEDHADAWFVGYTRDLSTAVWMGYPRGEIPMLSVHGQEVAGATFPVPIWHRFMAAAEWRKPARNWITPTHEVNYRTFEKHYYGYTSYTSSYSSYSGYSSGYSSSYSSNSYSSSSSSSSSDSSSSGSSDSSSTPSTPAPSASRPTYRAPSEPRAGRPVAPTPRPAPKPAPQAHGPAPP